MQEYTVYIEGETSHRHANIMQTGNRDKTDVESQFTVVFITTNKQTTGEKVDIFHPLIENYR